MIVDYAHTDDALRNLTALARQMTAASGARVITLLRFRKAIATAPSVPRWDKPPLKAAILSCSPVIIRAPRIQRRSSPRLNPVCSQLVLGTPLKSIAPRPFVPQTSSYPASKEATQLRGLLCQSPASAAAWGVSTTIIARRARAIAAAKHPIQARPARPRKPHPAARRQRAQAVRRRTHCPYCWRASRVRTARRVIPPRFRASRPFRVRLLRHRRQDREAARATPSGASLRAFYSPCSLGT